MPREYRHISLYEKEILELKEKGLTQQQIADRLGFSKQSVKNFLHRYRERQRKLAAGTVIRKKGRPPKNCVVSEKDKVAELQYIIARKRVKLKTFEEARKLINEYIYFYNYERIQLKTKLTPLEKRSQYVA